MDFYAELELPGLGKIDKPIKIDNPINELQFPLATCYATTGVWADIAEAASINYKRYKFLKRGMYPSAWTFPELDEHGMGRPQVKAFTVLYELAEIV